MFNLGASELLLIAVLALIFIGPKQLPEVAKAVGKMLAEFKKASGDLTETLKQSALTDELKKSLNPLHYEDHKPVVTEIVKPPQETVIVGVEEKAQVEVKVESKDDSSRG